MTTTYFAHRVDAAIERYDYKGIERNYLLGAVPWALSRALPVFFALAFGGSFVETVVTGLANVQWLANGLKLAGQMLPGLGFVNNFKSVSMIGIAIIGIFLAVQHFKNSQRTVVAAPASNVESGEIEDDEF